jgi:hypothetical protein
VQTLRRFSGCCVFCERSGKFLRQRCFPYALLAVADVALFVLAQVGAFFRAHVGPFFYAHVRSFFFAQVGPFQEEAIHVLWQQLVKYSLAPVQPDVAGVQDRLSFCL